jgi:hypothetical protein
MLGHASALSSHMGRALYIESVDDAASIAGGYDRLADSLGVSRDEVLSWSAGTVTPECNVFLRLIQIIIDPPPIDRGMNAD